MERLSPSLSLPGLLPITWQRAAMSNPTSSLLSRVFSRGEGPVSHCNSKLSRVCFSIASPRLRISLLAPMFLPNKPLVLRSSQTQTYRVAWRTLWPSEAIYSAPALAQYTAFLTWLQVAPSQGSAFCEILETLQKQGVQEPFALYQLLHFLLSSVTSLLKRFLLPSWWSLSGP